MFSAIGILTAISLAVGCAVFGGLWLPGDPVKNIFPNRDGFGGGRGVQVQLGEGGGGVKVQNQTGAYTQVVGQAQALAGDAVGLFADTKGGGGGRGGWVGGIECGENSRGGVVHDFYPCQQGVDTLNIDAYRPVSSGSGFSFSPLPFLPGPRSDNASHGLKNLRGVSFSNSVFFC